MRANETEKYLRVTVLALVLYLVLSLFYFGGTGSYARNYLGVGPDPTAYIWFLNWWPWAITRGHNPFITHYVWYPDGFNMTWAGSVPAAALLMWPVTWLGNAVVSYNILSLLAPAFSAWTGFLLARYLTRDTASSLVGGYLFGFSSHALGQMLGHLNLELTFIVPLVALLAVQRFRGDLSRARFVGVLAMTLLLQLGLATEILATLCLCGAITWAIFFAFAVREERGRLWMLAQEVILAAPIMVILAAPFLFFVAKGLANVPPIIRPPADSSADLLNYFIPTEITLLGGNLFRDIARRFPSNISEQGAYLGLPLLLILLLQFRETLRRPHLKPLLVTLLAIVILSLGPRLRIAGLQSHLGLPWQLVLHLPLVRSAMPTRLTMYVSFAAALAAALWLTAAKGGRDRAGRFTLAAFACLFILPNRAMFRWTPLALEAFFQPENVTATLGHSSNVIILPYGPTGPCMIWQWQSGMGFTQSGGYVGLPPVSEQVWPILHNLRAGIPGSEFENGISSFCVAHNVSAVLLGPGTPAPLAAALDRLGWNNTQDHGVRIVRVPDPKHLNFYYVLGDYWPSDEPDSWMGHEIKIVTRGKPIELQISGRYRPPKLGAVNIRVDKGSEVSNYRIAQQVTQAVDLPADASIIVTASSTFVPARILHNDDDRALSVLISLRPASP